MEPTVLWGFQSFPVHCWSKRRNNDDVCAEIMQDEKRRLALGTGLGIRDPKP